MCSKLPPSPKPTTTTTTLMLSTDYTMQGEVPKSKQLQYFESNLEPVTEDSNEGSGDVDDTWFQGSVARANDQLAQAVRSMLLRVSSAVQQSFAEDGKNRCDSLNTTQQFTQSHTQYLLCSSIITFLGKQKPGSSSHPGGRSLAANLTACRTFPMCMNKSEVSIRLVTAFKQFHAASNTRALSETNWWMTPRKSCGTKLQEVKK